MLTQTPAWLDPATPSTLGRWEKRAPWLFCIFAAVLVLGFAGVLGVLSLTTTDASGGGGSFYASAGWTIQRAADLSIKIEYDDGVSRSRADCAMKAIVGVTTWLEWQSMGNAGQLSVIRAAEAAC